jgi:hypothetical protein
MQRKRLFSVALLIAILAALLYSSLVLSANPPAISWSTIGGGGGNSQAGNFEMNVTVGQGLAGTASSGSWHLCAGFWCGPAKYYIHLPLIRRDG